MADRDARGAAVDETGAGDVFVAALAVDGASGASWNDAARYANAASALSVSRRGLSLPTATEVAAAVADISAAERRGA